MELIENLKNVWVIPLGEDGYVWASLAWIANGIFWLLDLYPLVKKKSRRETIAVMLLPGFIFVSMAVLSSFMLGITTGIALEDGIPFMRKRVCIELLILASFFLIVWFLAMWLRGGRNDTWKKRLFWALSYVPDLIIVGCILTVSLSRLIGGIYLLPKLWSLSTALGFTSYNIFAWLYVYGIMTLLIRLALLLVAIFARLISMRIPVGAYRENSHPARRFLWYTAICQNAYLRGVLVFFVPVNIFFVAMIFMNEPGSLQDTAMIVGFFFFIGAEAFTAVLIALKPTVESLKRFSKWGDRKAFLERFCREYFNETPVLRTSDYTMTRHFLVDERSTACVYYLEMLNGWSCCERVSVTDYEQKNNTYWSQPHTVDQAQRNGWQWEISFLGGDICVIEKEDASADVVLKSLSSYWESHQLAERQAPQSGIRQSNSQGDGFDKLFRFGMGVTCLSLILALLISNHNIMVSGGTPQQTDDFGEEKESFHLHYGGIDTGVEIFFKDCVCEYDKDDIRVYTCFVDDPAIEAEGYVIYIQTPEETMELFPEKYYLLDKNAGRLFTLWVETRGDIEIFGRIQGIDFANGMSNYKVLGIYNLEELIAEAYGLELLDYDEDFDCQQLEFTGIYEKDGRTVLRGRASALYNISGKEYSIEWEIDTETTHESAKAYLSDFDIHPLYAAFLRNEIGAQNPFVPEGDDYNAELSFFDDREYDQKFRKNFSLVDVDNDGDPEFVFKMTDSPSELVYILGVQDDKLICYDVQETHTSSMSYTVYDSGIVRWGQSYDGAEAIYYTFTHAGKVHELIHFVREESSNSDLYYDYYYLEGNEESRFSLRSNEEYESLVSSYEGEEPEWFDCEHFADILMR